jgi:hypothetical protein
LHPVNPIGYVFFTKGGFLKVFGWRCKIFNILTEHSLKLGDEFPPYKEIIINYGRHCFLDGDAQFYTIKVTLSHCIPLTA